MIVLGIDPGSATTGLCLVDTNYGTEHGHGLVATTHSGLPIGPGHTQYAADVLRLATAMLEGTGSAALIAVENLTPAGGFKRGKRDPINPQHLVATGVLIGQLLAGLQAIRGVRHMHHPLLLVDPVGNGSKPLGAYPANLVSDGERRTAGWELRVGTGQLRHARSAHDVAMATRHPHHCTTV